MDKSKRRKKPPTTLKLMWQIVDIPGKKANKDSSLDTTFKKNRRKIVYFNGFFHNV